MKRSFIPFVALALLTMAAPMLPAWALDLQTARAQGIVKELPSGYIAVVTPSADAQALVAQVNAARKTAYEQISKENGQPIDVVGKIAAKEIAQKLQKEE